MAKDKTHGCNMHLPVCASQVACDGTSVKTDGASCSKCRDKMAKKAKAPPPLRGSNTKPPKASL
jgi:hypothetical protein